MSDIKDELPNIKDALPKTLIDCLEEIGLVATSTDGTEAERRGQIVRLTNHAELLIGVPNEVMAAKAAHVQKLIAEGVHPVKALRVAGLA